VKIDFYIPRFVPLDSTDVVFDFGKVPFCLSVDESEDIVDIYFDEVSKESLDKSHVYMKTTPKDAVKKLRKLIHAANGQLAMTHRIVLKK